MDVAVKDSDNVAHKISVDTLQDGSDTQVVKLQIGSTGVDAGLISDNNPLPTQDKNIGDLYNMLGFFLDRLEFGLLTDNAKRLKVNLADSGALASVGTVTTVTTVGTVNNQARIGDVQAQRVVEAQMDTAFNIGLMNRVTF